MKSKLRVFHKIMYPEHLTENYSMTKNTMETSFLKQELIELCRICEETEDLVDITSDEFSHLNEKLHQIADFEVKYLRYVIISLVKLHFHL